MREFLIDRAIIRKWTQITGTARQRIRSTATVDASLQQLSRSNAERFQGTIGQDFMIYLATDDLNQINISIEAGDQIQIKETGDIYKVNTKYKVELGVESHLELFVTKVKQQ